MNSASSVEGVAAWTLIDVPVVQDVRGDLCFMEAHRHVPFQIERVYWVYDIPEHTQRGGHAHRTVREFVVAAAGEFDMHCNDGVNRETIHLDSPARGLLLAPGVWRELEGFSPGAVCVVLASGPYEEDEYVRDYEEFAALTQQST